LTLLPPLVWVTATLFLAAFLQFDSFVHRVLRHVHWSDFQPHADSCDFACLFASIGVISNACFGCGLCATAGVAKTMLTANAATVKHRFTNLTLSLFPRFHLGYHDFPSQIRFSMTVSFRKLSVNFTTRSASNMLAQH
jgi:hypothetical protein